MKLFRQTLIILSIWVMLSGGPALAAIEVPSLSGRVNDHADMLSPGTERVLAAELKSLEQTDSTQIVVLTIPGLDGEPIEEFSLRAAEKWKIGQEKLDNGALLVISKKDREMRIEVGYGLEGRLTDLISGRIIRNVMVPAFRSGDIDRGVVDGVSAMIAAVRGEYAAEDAPGDSSSNDGQGGLFALIIFGFLIIQLGRIRRSVGTVAGGILLPVFVGMFFPVGAALLLLLIPVGFVSGFGLSMFGSALGVHAGTHGYRHGSSRSSGGFWMGGGGGLGGGGGFGGFSGGGGGFGGGGASGGW